MSTGFYDLFFEIIVKNAPQKENTPVQEGVLLSVRLPSCGDIFSRDGSSPARISFHILSEGIFLIYFASALHLLCIYFASALHPPYIYLAATFKSPLTLESRIRRFSSSR